MEVGRVPCADVRRRRDRRLGLHGEEGLLETGGNQPGDLAVATHCSSLATDERSNSSNDNANTSGSAASKSYSLRHRIQRMSTSNWRHLAVRRSYGELFGCRGSVFAATEYVDQKITDSMLPSTDPSLPVFLERNPASPNIFEQSVEKSQRPDPER